MKSVFLFLLGSITLLASAQVDRNVIVEHFTNTHCSTCASRNPGLLNNLSEHNSDVIHISYFPSRPYADCKLNNHNGAENDDRTKYYGIFGSTPQIVIQGETKPNANFTNTQLFDDYKNETTSYASSTQYMLDDDSMYVRVVLQSPSTTNWENVQLLVQAAEDTVFHEGRNGEKMHFNVFRRSFTGIDGIAVEQMLNMGDSMVYYFSLPLHSDWNPERMKALTILQRTDDKTIVQAEEGTFEAFSKPVGTTEMPKTPLTNIRISTKTIQFTTEPAEQVSIYNLQGQVVLQAQFVEQLSIATLPKGLYVIRYSGNTKESTKKFVKR